MLCSLFAVHCFFPPAHHGRGHAVANHIQRCTTHVHQGVYTFGGSMGCGEDNASGKERSAQVAATRGAPVDGHQLSVDWFRCRSNSCRSPGDQGLHSPMSQSALGLARLGRRSSRCGRRGARRVGGRGFRFRRRLAPGRSGIGRSRFRRRAALRGVVVNVPARALELQAGCGQQTLQRAAALRALGLRIGAEALYFFETMATLSTAIRIERQFYVLQGEASPCFHCIGRTESVPIVAAFAGSSARECLVRFVVSHPFRKKPRKGWGTEDSTRTAGITARNQCTRTGTEARSFSHSRVMRPLLPPSSLMVQVRSSTIDGGLLILIFTRPRSLLWS